MTHKSIESSSPTLKRGAGEAAASLTRARRDAASAYRMGCMAQLGQAEQDDGFTTVAVSDGFTV